MTHVRKQIRDAVETRLTSLATTGANVFMSRIYSVAEGSLPALLIYAVSEQADIHIKGRPATLLRTMELRIEGMAETSGATLDDTLDQIALEVEHAMNSDMTFSGLALRSTLTGSEISFNGEGDAKGGSVILTYEIIYRTVENAVETSV